MAKSWRKLENIRLARARRKQKYPASRKFRGQATKPPKPAVIEVIVGGE